MNIMLKMCVPAILLGAGLMACAPLSRFEDTATLAAQTAVYLKEAREQDRGLHTQLQDALASTAAELDSVRDEGLRRQSQLQEELARLRRQLEGTSSAAIHVPAGMVSTAIFGNHAGRNAVATITHRVEGFKGLGTSIRIVRVKRPRDVQATPTSQKISELDSAGSESTTWLELSSAGSRRQLVVPCGYQVEARSLQGATIDLLLKYQNKECQ